jgi:hypothetical protein
MIRIHDPDPLTLIRIHTKCHIRNTDFWKLDPHQIGTVPKCLIRLLEGPTLGKVRGRLRNYLFNPVLRIRMRDPVPF